MYDKSKIVLDKNALIINALEIINKGYANAVLIVDEKNNFMGLASDGDIRRGLLNGLSTSSKIIEVMNRDPFVLREGYRPSEIDENLDLGTVVPVINSSHKLISYIVCKKKQLINNTVVIMVGGYGKRLGMLTDNTPKPMLELKGRPILEYILRDFVNQGFHKFIFTTHYLSEKIVAHFGDGKEFNVNIKYIHEEEPLGTAGSLALIGETDSAEPIIVSNGDVISAINYREALQLHKSAGHQTTLITANHEYNLQFGQVIKDDMEQVCEIREKPTFSFEVLAGSYIFDWSQIKLIKKSMFLNMDEFIDMQLKKKSLIGTYKSDSYWLDIGVPSSLQKASDVF